ncbi:serrate RNA effector molecule-like isoform X2 [Zingiber officinale]|uniref:serrate RNA effector molecule-like isoform X2 n=1 Tax=Zingiber officinale TaxID=94328 RepID=UPI001C4BE6C3|nr:serrate RNA effector molecule-like isoform X2 [Zingiber officinale]
MADVIDMPSDAPDRSGSIQPDQRESTTAGSPSPPLPPPPPRKRGRDSKEERDDWPPGRRNDHRDSRDGSPPLSPPPPVSAPKDDKNREYRRRNSPSSPSYRDRRHPSPRRSPPHGPFKRARKDGGGYDRRRGSPRGGYGPDEKRYGYDYDRGYDRGGSGGRGWYGEERSQGRHGNRLSYWPDSGHGSYGDDSESIQRGGLMSYKQFMQELEDDILPAEAERRYEEYRSEYISTQKRAYFEAHKEEKWLKDKYHPTNLVVVIERRKELAKSIAKDFLLDLQSGTLDVGPGLTATSARKSGNSSEPNSDEETDISGKRRRHGRGPAKENEQLSAAPKANPVSSEIRRIQIDILQAQALVRKLDIEKGIQDNVLSSSDQDDADKTHGGSLGPIVIIRGLTTVKGLEGVELLDTLITYLWRVHGLNYYGMSETSEAKGLRHVRADIKADGANSSGSEWEQKLDSFWQTRLEGQDPLEILTAKDKIDAAATEALDPVVRKIRDEKYGWKYGCGAKGCTKLFHAPEFVHKHLKLKHPELVIEFTSNVREDLYFQNYMNDPNAPGGTPIMQQSAPKARVQRRRLLDNRLRDAHGNRIELNRNRDDDRNDSSPSDNHGGLDGETYEKPPYDAHRGGLHSAFPSDIPPPPILVPVPGAGPLGPFVPAPPEVAMRMLTDPGGPPSFDTAGGLHGRKGRLGQQLGGTAAPILAMPPPFRHDPRRMRSYRDLDAPDDEVTVLDYRSL